MVASTSPVFTFHGLSTTSPDVQRVLEEARLAAASDLGVLLTGETGTGKDLLARAIHRASLRRDCPFVTVDCSALPPATLHSELFGHARGSFSGAERSRRGRFEAAAGGTVFLDRIDDLDPGVQAHLLRVIEEREVQPLGECRPRKVDFRLLASAGTELRQRAMKGLFRRDLFYRINVVELELPALRDRPEDIPFLAREFLLDSARRSGKPIRDFSRRALQVMTEYLWPGNVRELRGSVEAAVASARGELVEESDLPVYLRVRRRSPPADPPAGDREGPGPSPAAGEEEVQTFAQRVSDFQRNLLLEALGKYSWNRREVARELGLEDHQLKYLCAKLGIRRSGL